MRRQKFRMTRLDIKKGQRRTPSSCPVALCVARTLVEDHVSVGSSFVSCYRENGSMLRSKLTGKVEKFIRDFDNGKKVEPISFILEIPEAE
jgi:hypothetical protein